MLTLVTPPAVEPVTLAEMKAHLRLQVDFDDPQVEGFIRAARIACEHELGQAFVATVFDWAPPQASSLRGYPWSAACLDGVAFSPPRGPLLAVASVSYLDASGSTVVAPPSAYVVRPGRFGEIAPVVGQSFPFGTPSVVRFTAGWGPDAASVPENIKLAVKMLGALYYRDRFPEGEFPPFLRAVLQPSAGRTTSYAR